MTLRDVLTHLVTSYLSGFLPSYMIFLLMKRYLSDLCRLSNEMDFDLVEELLNIIFQLKDYPRILKEEKTAGVVLVDGYLADFVATGTNKVSFRHKTIFTATIIIVVLEAASLAPRDPIYDESLASEALKYLPKAHLKKKKKRSLFSYL